MAQMEKNPTCKAGNLGLILGLGRSPGEGNGYPLQYSGLENPMDRGACWVTVHGVAKSWTQLSNFHSLCVAVTTWSCKFSNKAKEVIILPKLD